MSGVNRYFPIKRVRDFLSKHKLYGLDHLFAALFGAITPFCPVGYFEKYLSKENYFAVPLQFCFVSMYSNIARIVPIMEVLVDKGIPIGTALAFIMAMWDFHCQRLPYLKK